MKKIVFVLIVLVFGLIISARFLPLKSYAGAEVLNFGVYANDGDSNIFDGCFDHGFMCEICHVTPEIYYSYQGGEVIGEFFETTLDNFNLNEFANRLGLVIYKTTYVGPSYNIYACSALVPYRQTRLDTNVQISVTGNNVVVATPIIMGSF